MNYKETINKGLKRGYEVVIESKDLADGISQKTEEIRKTIKVDGFRPGKVPASIVNQKHGESIKAEVLNKLINDNVFSIVDEKKFRPIAQPKVDLKEKKNETDDTIFSFELELFPEIKLVDFQKIKIESLFSNLLLFAALKPIFVANAVFPIPGLPARTTRSDLFKPPN